MAVGYLLHDHEGELVGRHTAGTHLAVGEEIIHEDHCYLVVLEPPPHGASFIDPLFNGYAVEDAEHPDALG